MIKHVIKFSYTTIDNAAPKFHTTIMEFTEVQNQHSSNLKIAVCSLLMEMHNLLIKKFPKIGFAPPFLKDIIEVKIINN